ncbi:MAG: hypothetical protein ACI4AM_09725 [Muribaculaceae bacterium]
MEQTESSATTYSRRHWAQIVSDICSPLLVPTYGTALAMWFTNLRAVPEVYRLIVTAIVAFITAGIPLATVLVLMRRGRVSDMPITRRGERIAPMWVASMCYVGTSFLLGYFGCPMWLRLFMCGAGIATVIALIITIFWKISAHTTGMGGLVALVLWTTLHGIADLGAMILLSVVVLLCGLVATARLRLERHTFAQVITGALLGFTVCFFTVSLFA